MGKLLSRPSSCRGSTRRPPPSPWRTESWQVDRSSYKFDIVVEEDVEDIYKPVTQPGQIIFIPTELLSLGLTFVLTESFIDDRPDHVIVLHCDTMELMSSLEMQV